MMRRYMVIAAALVALPVAAKAQPVTGLYVGGAVGVNKQLDIHDSFVGATIHSDVGVAVDGALGYGLGNGVRVELEGDFRYQHCDVRGKVHSNGSCYTYGPMLNALYDFDFGSNFFYPYIGVGVGAQWAKFSAHGTSTSSDPQAAAQGIVGVAFPLTPQLSITADARAIAFMTEPSISHTRVTNPVNVSGMIGLRYAFNAPAMAAPAPAPKAMPAPAPARTYLVFFDWDKADLTDRARQIIADAAQASTSVATTQIEVDGHADLSGTPQYNQGLSLRRARAVGAELVKDGVPQNIIMIQAFGDTRPLVPTARGVREPQNRRVEIILK